MAHHQQVPHFPNLSLLLLLLRACPHRLNQAGQVYQQLSERYSANCYFKYYKQIVVALNAFSSNPNAIRSLCLRCGHGLSHQHVMFEDWYQEK